MSRREEVLEALRALQSGEHKLQRTETGTHYANGKPIGYWAKTIQTPPQAPVASHETPPVGHNADSVSRTSSKPPNP